MAKVPSRRRGDQPLLTAGGAGAPPPACRNVADVAGGQPVNTSSVPWPLRLVTLAAAIALLGVSGFFNWRFGTSFGRTPIEAQAWGVASLASDAMKATAPVIILWAIRRREMLTGVVAVAVLAVTAAWSLAAAIGFAATARQAALTRQTEGTPAYKRALAAEARATRAIAQLTADAPPRPPAWLEAEIARLKAVPGANGCVRVDGPISRRVCAQVARLQGELARGRALAAAKAERAEARAAMERVSHTADPQSRALAGLGAALGLALTQDQVRLALIVLAVALVEIGSAFGLLLANVGGAHLKAREVHTGPAWASSANPHKRDRGGAGRFVGKPAQNEQGRRGFVGKSEQGASAGIVGKPAQDGLRGVPAGGGGVHMPACGKVHSPNAVRTAVRGAVAPRLLRHLEQSGGRVTSSWRGLAIDLGVSASGVRRAAQALAAAGAVRIAPGRKGTALCLAS